eukprot:CAMPEP_0201548784 /NCGR_PEP_ID=MMETSP0173_2-20130828/5294_1 /ASSEMBLY_ACC=CAM_ASM_000268 /TAXON_ID=218659 /ORGANISM="Vexillifera sp., Strain DIVA3 564/2" /LENGTH=355 /DNA_ID=CAMNT_0047958259 /DNA_START=76 /DNA_END=1143 /DNA_ORIENTATION=-
MSAKSDYQPENNDAGMKERKASDNAPSVASNADEQYKQQMSKGVVKGEFVRSPTSFRDWIRADGSTKFAPEANRYHLIVSYACPWASRALFLRAFKGLEDVIDVTVVDWLLPSTGWRFTDKVEGCNFPSFAPEMKQLRDLYDQSSDGEFEGRVTVPVLYDTKEKVIVNNESSELIRMLNSEFNAFATKNKAVDFYPSDLAEKIDQVNAWVYPQVNNGVYRCGFARSQQAYDQAVEEHHQGINRLEKLLSKQRYLASNDRITEADVRLFVTLVRMDSVYAIHFKTSCRLQDFPNLLNYTRELYQLPGIASTVNMEHIKHHYYESHTSLNPEAIVARAWDIDFNAPHNRDTQKFDSK